LDSNIDVFRTQHGIGSASGYGCRPAQIEKTFRRPRWNVAGAIEKREGAPASSRPMKGNSSMFLLPQKFFAMQCTFCLWKEANTNAFDRESIELG
jgi:hypothetical protein